MEQHAAGFQRLAGIDPLVQEMHAVVALHLATSLRPRKKVPVTRTLCEIPALMPPSSPGLMSSFGQGQATTSRDWLLCKRALWISALACLGLDISFSYDSLE